MAYNTFPTFQGTGWDIKKRQLWSTDVEVSASGAEFRTGYWANPIYEFDISINYMSQSDMQTLQAFYVQQQGPLIPFLYAPINDSTPFSAQVFFTGNGTTKTAALPTWPAVITAMHQTDWQGRVALSDQPRTNIVTNTDLTSATWTSSFPTKGTCTVAPTPIPGPTQTYQIVSGTAVSTAADSCIISGNFTASAGAYSSSCFVSSGSYAAACVAVVVNGSQPHVVQIDPATGAMMGFDSVITGGLAQLLGTRTSIGQWVRVTLQIAAPSGTTFLNIRIGGVPTYGYSGSFGNDGKGIYASSPTLEAGSYAGVYIPTTSAPVTVTDYAVDASGNVTFGQAPASGATVDQDGQAAYIVRFVDDQTSGGRSTGGTSSPLEINQFMSGMYEQAGITLRTVR